MPEKLIDILQRTSSLLHWLGKYEESNELNALMVHLRSIGVNCSDELGDYILSYDYITAKIDLASNEDIDGCYKMIQKLNKEIK